MSCWTCGHIGEHDKRCWNHPSRQEIPLGVVVEGKATGIAPTAPPLPPKPTIRSPGCLLSLDAREDERGEAMERISVGSSVVLSSVVLPSSSTPPTSPPGDNPPGSTPTGLPPGVIPAGVIPQLLLSDLFLLFLRLG